MLLLSWNHLVLLTNNVDLGNGEVPGNGLSGCLEAKSALRKEFR